MKRFQILVVLVLFGFAGAVMAEGGHAHWDYEGHAGPAHWGELSKDYEACAHGKNQSPVNISKTETVQLDPLKPAYKASAFRIVDNGHTVQVNFDKGNTLTVNGTTFDLVQFHFHAPSEETFKGKAFDMVAHLVHKDAKGNLAVIAVEFNAADNAAHATLSKLFKEIPTKVGEESKGSFQLNPADLLPAKLGYYTFAGSLTTPPCSEGVTWLVLKNAVATTKEQVGQFAKIHPRNARPVQPLNGRVIKASKE